MLESLAARFFICIIIVGVFMYEMLKDIACVVTAIISFTYGARVSWGLGRKNPFKNRQDNRALFLIENVPVATFLHSIGFFIFFSYWFSNVVTIAVFSLTSSILLTVLLVAVSLPKPQKYVDEGLAVELVDGTVCQMSRDMFEYYLLHKKVHRFKRSDGWVVIGRDRLRSSSDAAVFVGVERRKP